jgi:hypothetical protein
MKNICNIPTEIISNIMQSIGVNGIVMMTKISKEFHNKKKEIYLHYFQNDDFIFNYMNDNKINIIHMLSESAFSFQDFDIMYANIKYDNFQKKPLKNICLKKENRTQNQINNTFRIFQILKLSVYDYNVTKKHQHWYNSCKMIMDTMEYYFKDLFFARNKNKVYISFIDSSLSVNYMWEKSNINLYNICENLNLIYCDQNIDNRLKKNLENFSNTIIKNDGKNVVITASLIQCLFKKNQLFEKLNFDIYINYVFFHYLNFMFRCNLYEEILGNQDFYDHSFEIHDEFETKIREQPSDKIAPYFKNMILNDLEQYTLYILL